MLRKGATFTLPEKSLYTTLCKIRGLNTTRNEAWRFQPRHLCLTLQLKVLAITLRRKSARRSIVYLIPLCVAFFVRQEIKIWSSNETTAQPQIK